jgi:hypothetical protein
LPAGKAGEDPGGAPGGVQAGDAVHDFLGDGGSAGVVGVAADPQHLGGVRELDSAGAGDPDGAPDDPPVAVIHAGIVRRGAAVCADLVVDGSLESGLVALDQESDRLRRFRALLPCEVVVTALAHPLCGCRVRAYAFRHVDGVPHLKVELPDGMPGLVAADATDVFGAGPAAAGAGLVLDGAGLRHLHAVVTRLRDGDGAGEQR